MTLFVNLNPLSPSERPSLLQALSPIVILIGLLTANVYFFGEDSSYGSNQIALLLAAAVAGFVQAMPTV